MSKTRCPKCGTKIVAQVVLREHDWSIKGKRPGPPQKFDRAEAFELYRSGVGIPAIALHFGVSREAVRQAFRRDDLVPPDEQL